MLKSNVGLLKVRYYLNLNYDKKGFFINRYFNKNRSFSVGDVVSIKYLTPSNRSGLSVRSFSGVCLAVRNNGLHTNLLIRNSFRSNSVEFRFFLFSPLILNVNRLYRYRKKFRLSKLYFIRNLRQRHFAFV